MQQARTVPAKAAEQVQTLSAAARQALTAALDRAGLRTSVHERIPGAAQPDQGALSAAAHFVGSSRAQTADTAGSGVTHDDEALQHGAEAVDKHLPSQDPWASLRRALAPEGTPRTVRWSDCD